MVTLVEESSLNPADTSRLHTVEHLGHLAPDPYLPVASVFIGEPLWHKIAAHSSALARIIGVGEILLANFTFRQILAVALFVRGKAMQEGSAALLGCPAHECAREADLQLYCKVCISV